jgi:hypothetical protein
MMKRRVASWLAVAAAVGLVPAAGGALAAYAEADARAAAGVCLVPGTGQPLDQLWQPDMTAAIGYAGTRAGDIAFAVRTEDNFYAYRPDHVDWSASVVKAMLMVAYLDLPSVANRQLNGGDDALLVPMITQSDNNAATAVRNIVGNGNLQALANRVGMTNFETNPVWGLTRITARDQTLFFLHIDSFIAPLHRAYALHLLASITPSQRWGIGEVPPAGWKLYFKGGWGSGTGAVDHQVALLVRGCARVAIAVLTLNDGSHDYGKETLREIFARLLRGLPSGATIGGWTQPRTISPQVSDKEFAHYFGRATGEILIIQSVHAADDTLATVPISGLASGQPRRLIGPLRGGTIEDVAFGAGERAVAVGVSGGVFGKVQARSRFASGRAFRRPETLSTRGARSSQPVVAMNASGAAVVAWITAARPGGNVVEAAVRPAGAPSFRPTQKVSTQAPGTTRPAVAINSQGVATVAWADNTEVQATSGSGGSFSTPVVLGPSVLARGLDPTGELAVASGRRGLVLVAWGAFDRVRGGKVRIRILESQCSANGRFGAPVTLTPQASDKANYGPVAAITTRGTALIAFATDRSVVVASGRAGTRLGSVQTIGALRHGAPSDPALGTNSAGGVVLAWDERLSSCCGVTRVTTRRTGRTAFGVATSLSSASELGLYPAAALSSAGNGAVAWVRSERGFGDGQIEASLSG